MARNPQSQRFEKTHGGYGTRLYTAWREMKARCHNPEHRVYVDYGGRGITVCNEWSGDFAAFRDWAMANGYRDDLTLDRIDNDKGYSPENCRWATHRTQNNNRRDNRRITLYGETLTMAEWSQKTGIPWSTLYSRIYQSGWSIERALTTPRRERSVTHEKRTTRAARA